METFDKNSPAYKKAVEKVKALKGFYAHLFFYVIINAFLLIMIYSDTKELRMENFYVLFFWGIGLLFHAANVFLPNLIFGKRWEDKKIEELTEKYKSEDQIS